MDPRPFVKFTSLLKTFKRTKMDPRTFDKVTALLKTFRTLNV